MLGSGIVTRRPLVLQLMQTPAGSQEYGEFLHIPQKRFYDFSQIREEISRETDRVTGKNKGISALSINLRIYSPRVVNLALVDLPGITKVPVGDQPTDIERQVRHMILSHIEKPNAIILAVTAANTDLANSDALKLASKVDPEGKRTLGIITKLDLMDKGTDARDALMGKIIRLRLGYIGVINRSQSDINEGIAISDAIQHETEFFDNHPTYRAMRNQLGTEVLSKTLNRLLLKHIRDTMPDIRQKINSQLAAKHTELAKYGDDMGAREKGALLLSLLQKFANDFKDAINGRAQEIGTNELQGGARISYIFSENFMPRLAAIDPTEQLSEQDIRTAIKNATGSRPALFVSEASFELLVRKQIERLEQPSVQCFDLVFEEMIRITYQVDNKEMQRFRVLQDRIVEVVTDLLRSRRPPTNVMIRNLIEIETAYINTAHPDFVGGTRALEQMFEKVRKEAEERTQRRMHQQQVMQNQASQGPSGNAQPGYQPYQPQAADPQKHKGPFGFLFGGKEASKRDPTPPREVPAYQQSVQLTQMPSHLRPSAELNDQEKLEIEIIRRILVSYFDIVRKNVLDTVPKTIMHFLVNYTMEHLQAKLVSELYKEDEFDRLLEEDESVALKRKECAAMISALTKAARVLNDVRDDVMSANM